MLTRSLASLRLYSPEPLSHSPLHPLPPPAWLLQLPREMLHHLLSFLPLPDCGQLCLASLSVKELLLDWITSPSCLQQLTAGLARLPPDSEARLQLWLTVCRQLGVFCKRATMLDCPGTRLSTLTNCYSGLQELGCSGLDSPWAEVTRKAGLAAALHTLSLGWDDREHVGIHHLLEQTYPVLQNLPLCPTYLTMEPGVPDKDKAELRSVLRLFYWEGTTDEASLASWLSSLLQRFSSPHFKVQGNFTTKGLQSMLLFFMLGTTEPRSHGSFKDTFIRRLYTVPDYSMLQHPVASDSYSEAKLVFGDLGKALRVLEDHRGSINLGVGIFDLVVSLTDGMGWETDNQAACLLFSSEGVVGNFLRGLMKDREEKHILERVAKLLAAMLVVCDRLGNRLNQGLANIMDYAFSGLIGSLAQRKRLIAAFWRELGPRLEDDLGMDIMVQVGVHIGNRAFRSKEVMVRQFNCQSEE